MTNMIYRTVAHSGTTDGQSTARTPQALMYRGVAHTSRPAGAARPATKDYAMIYRGAEHLDLPARAPWDLATAVAV